MTKRLKHVLLSILAACSAGFLLAGILLFLPHAAPVEADAALSVRLSVLPEGLDLFTDYTRTELNEAYRSEEAIETLREAHTDVDQAVFERALSVLHGSVRFDGNREFSTKEDAENKIEQYGSMDYYSNTTLHWHYSSSDLQITGIYGMTGDSFTVYVDSESDINLPQLVLTLQHGSLNNYRTTVNLFRGANTFSFSGFDEPNGGGAVYLRNEYTHEAQGDVSVYIEGGDFYPVFEKGGDVTAFLGDLKEYEEARAAGKKAPDLGELVTDFAFFTTTSQSLYDTYIKYRTIDPEENMELWGDFFTKLYEFNGLPTSEDSLLKEYYDPRIKGVRLNFRYMQVYQNSGAYATAHYIGFYNEHYWFANYLNKTDPVPGHTTDDYSIFAMGHEIGHMLDTDGRILSETTNNVSAAYAYLKVMEMPVNSKWQPFGTSLERLARDRDVDHKAYDLGKILYTTGNYDHNYMVWWYLESCFENYWAKLNAMYRYGGEAYLSNSNERMVYYSSLVTGVDLGRYFDRWGMYISEPAFSLSRVSQQYKDLMQKAKDEKRIEEKFDRYYYADDAEYCYIRENEHQLYRGDTPVLSVRKNAQGRVLSISGSVDPAHLGYEVRVSLDGGQTYEIAGFTRSAQFVDSYAYREEKEPVYKVIPVNRFFETGDESNAVSADETQQTDGVCRVNGTRYDTLLDGINAVSDGGTIYLLADCSIGKKDTYKSFTIEVDEDAAGDVRINNAEKDYLFHSCADLTLRGRKDAHIVIDGGTISRIYPPIFAGAGTFTAEYVDFAGSISSIGGGAIFAMTDTVLKNCTFSNCSGKDAGFISAYKSLTLENCTFGGEERDILLREGASLTFVGDIPKLRLSCAGATVRAEGFDPTPEQLARLDGGEGTHAVCNDKVISFGNGQHTLTFRADGQDYSFKSDGPFVFGQESLPLAGRYVTAYRDDATGQVYRAGEKIVPSEDMRFLCDTEEELSVQLLFKSGTQTVYARADGDVYLPRTDGKDRIARWTSRDGAIYLSGGSAPASERVLTPVYEGYFRYDLVDQGVYVDGGFETYGKEILLPAREGDFIGWEADGMLWNGSKRLTSDTVFVAQYRAELPSLSLAEIEFLESDLIYNGLPQCPAFRVMLGGKELAKDLYTAVYSNNTDAGTGLLTLTATSLAEGSLSKSFSISPRLLKEDDVIIEGLSDSVYTGKEIVCTPVLTFGGKVLDGAAYELSYFGDRVNAGIVTVIISFEGNYTGELELSYQILKARLVPPASVEAKDAVILGDIPLPDGWVWREEDTPVSGEGVMTAEAVYIKEDAKNYENTTAQVEILLSDPSVDPDPDEGKTDPDPDEGKTDPDPDEGKTDPDPDEGKTDPDPDEGKTDPDPDEGKTDPEVPDIGGIEPEAPPEPSGTTTGNGRTGCAGTVSAAPLLFLILCPFLFKKRKDK